MSRTAPHGVSGLRSTLLAVLWTMSATVALGQINTGEINGVVRDSSGGVLPGATVTATHPASGIVVERVTDGEGRFFLPALRIGAWDVERASRDSRRRHTQVVLEVGRA